MWWGVEKVWCICGKLESVKPEKRVVLMSHLWWKCGGGVEKVWSICGKSISEARKTDGADAVGVWRKRVEKCGKCGGGTY